MITLTIDEFSCLRSARLILAPVTVLIGPQGSGKSVTTKLNYFFCDLLSRHYQCAERGMDLDDFKKDTARQFRIWFPPTAWGKGRFNINFSAGEFTVRILRRLSRGTVADDVSVTFSDLFNKHYRDLRASYAEFRPHQLDDEQASFRYMVDGSLKIREQFERKFSAALKESYINYQMFIPAGRAFFTSVGRLVAAFEQGSSFDPVTLRFAKLFGNLRDRVWRYRSIRRGNNEDREMRRTVMKQLFGGEIRIESDLEFVQTNDGRRVPFSALSSGQQELLPMWLLIEYFADRSVDREQGNDLFYIEEPEAHLFPEAQSLLMDFLIGALVSQREKRGLILTTHSPYILGKLNNYLKAGSLGRIKKNAAAVSEVVPRECWLTPKRFKAYAIEDGTLRDLIDRDGLIDASYIDRVSEEVSRTFSSLLDIQYPETA